MLTNRGLPIIAGALAALALMHPSPVAAVPGCEGDSATPMEQ